MITRWSAAVLTLAGPLLVGAAVLGGAALALAPVRAEGGKASAAPVVVELFTSQGCSSCPPADALLTELAKEPGVIALSMHVDYWDYIGWSDPYSSPQITARQQSYAKDLKIRYVYTPQILVDGRVAVVGSRRDSVRSAVAQAALRGKPLDVRLVPDDGGKIIIPAGHAPDGGASVWLAVYDRVHETVVERGENAGRTLRNSNVVRDLVKVGTWTGEAMEIPVDLAAAVAQGRDGCAVIVQQGRTGPILGAAAMDIRG
jgi:hypothetical protein